MAAKDEIQRWQERIKAAERFRDESGGSSWNIYRQAYNNRFEEELHGDQMVSSRPGSKITYNLVFANEKALSPAINVAHPRVYLYPRRDPNAFLHVKALEAVDNMLIQVLGISRELRLAHKDTYLYGRGFVKMGIHREFTPVGLDPGPGGGPRTEYNVNIRQGLPWCIHTPAQMVYVPWGSTRFNDLRAIFHRIVRHIDDVRADPAYDSRVARKLKPNLIAGSLEGGFRMNGPLSDRDVNTELVELWEIHDLREGAVRVMSFDSDEWLLNFRHGTLWNPFESTVWNEDPTCFWAQGDVGQFWYQQLEMNSVRHTMRRLRRMILIRFLVEEGTFDEEQLSDLTDEDVFDMVLKVKGAPRDAIEKLVLADIPIGLFNYAELIRQDVREITGQGRNQMGEYDRSTRRTATEAGIVAGGAASRTLEKRRDGIMIFERIIRKMNWLITRYWTEAEAVEVGGGGPDALRFLLYFRASDMRDIDYGITTEIVSDEPETPLEREQKAMNLMPVLGPQMTQYLMSLMPNVASGTRAGVMLGPVGQQPIPVRGPGQPVPVGGQHAPV